MQYKFKKTLLIIPIACFLILGIVLLFFYREIKNNEKIAQQLAVNLQEENSKRNEIKTLNNYFQSIEKEKAQLETHFVQSSDVVPFLNTLENLASSVGTKTEVSSINLAKDNTGLIVEMKNAGTFSETYKFITLLENAPYELEFLSVDMHGVVSQDSLEGGGGTNKWEALIKLKLISFI
jgi:hypothetical protein